MKVFLLAIAVAATLSAATVNYSYDDAGRLIKVDYGNGQTISYTYDNAGNLLSRTVAAAASGQTAAPQSTASPKAPVAQKRRPVSPKAKSRPKEDNR